MMFTAEEQPDGWAVVTVVLRNPPGDQAIIVAGLPEGIPADGLSREDAEDLADKLNAWVERQGPQPRRR